MVTLHRLYITQRLNVAPGVVLSPFGQALRYYVEVCYNHYGKQEDLAKLHISSSYRPGDPGWHGRNGVSGACDISYYKGRSESHSVQPGDALQKDCAQLLYSNFRRWMELIHSTPFVTDSGFYVKNRRKVTGSYYGEPNYSSNGGHINHTHCAGYVADAQAIASYSTKLWNVSKVVYV
jgi:hypothetical protein